MADGLKFFDREYTSLLLSDICFGIEKCEQGLATLLQFQMAILANTLYIATHHLLGYLW